MQKMKGYYLARSNAPKASTKLEQIENLLFALQTPLSQEHQKRYWQLFESGLRQYLDFRYSTMLL